MKTTKLLTAACCLGLLGAQAQYGSRTYNHPNSIHSSGKITTSSPGFLSAGYQPTTPMGAGNFEIDRVDANGQFVMAGWPREYRIIDDPSCSGVNPSQMTTCEGVSVIETTDDPTTPAAVGVEAYAMAGTYKEGVFFATLDAFGNRLSTRRWLFPNGGSFTGRPSIVESTINPHDFFICGHVNATAFAIRVSANTFSPWAKIYPQVGMAYDLIESPYNANELILVGSQYNDDAYFMTIDPNSGIPMNFNAYGANVPTHADDWFTSIDVANSPNGGQGFIVGGRSLDPNRPGNYLFIPWMIKLDPNGGVIWSTLIEHSTPGIITAEISDVFERKRPNGETPYEYYGIAGCSDNGMDNMTVWRLDDNGTNTFVWPNEFIYPLGPSGSMWYKNETCRLDHVGDGSNAGDGFAAWSTDYVNNNHVFVKSYYNGIMNTYPANVCNETIQGMTQVHQGPGLLYSYVPAFFDWPFSCANVFDLQIMGGPGQESSCEWSPTTLPFGGNRQAATGIATNQAGSQAEGVYPNPVSGKTTVTFNAGDNSQVKIEVCNALGQLISSNSLVKSNAGAYQQEIDFESLGARPGVYLVNVTVDQTPSSHKVIYQGNR